MSSLLINKAQRKGRTREEVDIIICWFAGYDKERLYNQLDRNVDYEAFFTQASKMNPNCALIKGMICGVRVEDILNPLMQKIRYLDKLVDELARGKAMEKILHA